MSNHLDRVKKLKVIGWGRLSAELKKKNVLFRQKRSVISKPKENKKKSPVKKKLNLVQLKV